MHLVPAEILQAVIDAAEQAGSRLAEEFVRPEGPRFVDHVTAPVDHEIELFLRERLLALLPARFVGEEAGVLAGPENAFCWVVDPHDGTRAYLEGRRGSAVSIALLRAGQPVLAVVFAPLSPDRGADLIAWAEGGKITRNGVPAAGDLRHRGLGPNDVVFLNHGAWQRPVWNGTAVAPGRFMPLPSIAYRLARVAVGDGAGTVTLRPVNALDIAAGHALLLAAGGVLLAEDGTPVTYNVQGESRPSACIGGAPEAVRTLLSRAWRGSTEPRREPRIALSWPRAASAAALDRAIGCMLGLAIGDSLGGQVAFRSAAEIARDWPQGVRDLRGGGTWNTAAGQPGGGTELALALVRTLAGRREYDAEAAAEAYARWLRSGPFNCDAATRRAFAAAAAAEPGRRAEAMRAAADRDGQGSGALPRVALAGIWAGDARRAAAAAVQDSGLSHPHPVCIAAGAALAAAIAAGLVGADRMEMLAAAIDAARDASPDSDVLAVLQRAAAGEPPALLERQSGHALPALHNAFFRLASGQPAEAALIETAGAGGSGVASSTAMTGALLGAAAGRAGFPTRWTLPVLTCRPEAALGAEQPRPEEYWPDDLAELAEALLLGRSGSAGD